LEQLAQDRYAARPEMDSNPGPQVSMASRMPTTLPKSGLSSASYNIMKI